MLVVLLIGLCIWTVVDGQPTPTPCCSADKWSGHFSMHDGYWVEGTDNAGPSGVFERIYYDYTEKKLALEEYVYAPDAAGWHTRGKQIWNYNAGTMKRYSIGNDTKCTSEAVTGSMSKLCIPRDAKFHRTSYFGGPHHKLDTNEFIYNVGTLEMNITNTVTGCVPFLFRLFGTVQESGNTVYVVGEGHYFNITHAIHDTTVFDPPTDCTPGKVILQPTVLREYLKASLSLS